MARTTNSVIGKIKFNRTVRGTTCQGTHWQVKLWQSEKSWVQRSGNPSGWFENVKNLLIPELYLLSNYSLEKGIYSKSSDTINFSARTFHDFKNQIEKTIIKTTDDERFAMYRLLKIKEPFIFNNGDPIMFIASHTDISTFFIIWKAAMHFDLWHQSRSWKN